jgi:hypothetical protein
MTIALQVDVVESAVDLRQLLIDRFCEIRECDSVDVRTLGVLLSFARQHGHDRVVDWMRIARNNVGTAATERTFTRYLSGIRRRRLAEGEL